MSSKAYQGQWPLAYTRYTKTHWILYVRRISRRKGYSYRRKRKVVRVPAYRIVSYVEFSREPFKKPPETVWITKEQWIRGLEKQYEDFDRKRSDLPSSKEKWFRLKNNFLWMARKWPPLSESARYTLVILYLLVWDQDDEIHKIYAQRLLTIRKTHSGTDMNAGKDRLAQILAELPAKVEAQKKKLEESGLGQYIHVRGLAGWTVVPNADWYVKDQIRRAKNSKYWQKRDREEVRRRIRRERSRLAQRKRR